MATIEVPFENPERIKEKLCHYEELFKTRYTKEDEGFRRTGEMEERFCQVPVLCPWPPFQHNRRRRSKEGRETSRERGRGYPDDSNYAPPCSSSGRRSPRFYDQLVNSSSRGHRGHGHTPPPPYSVYNSYQRSPPRRYGMSPRKPGSPPHRSESSRRNEDDHFQECNVPFLRDDNKLTNLTPAGYPSSGDSSVMTKRSHEEESLASENRGRRIILAPLDLKEAAGIVEEGVILSQSDVQDILKGAASSGPCDVNLKVLKNKSKKSSKGRMESEQHNRKRKHHLKSDSEDHVHLSLGCSSVIRDHTPSKAAPLSTPPSAASILTSHKQTTPTDQLKHKAIEVEVVALNTGPVVMETDSKSAIRNKDCSNLKKMKKKKKKNIKEMKLGGHKRGRMRKRIPSESLSVSCGNDGVGGVFNEDDTGDVDVTTPLVGHSPLSFTLKRSLMMEADKEMEAVEEQLPLSKKQRKISPSKPLLVSIARNLVLKGQQQPLESESQASNINSTFSMTTPTTETSASRHATPSPQPMVSPGTCEVKFDGPSTKLIIRNLHKKKSKKRKKRA